MRILTVNVGTFEPSEHTGAPGGSTGIGKKPVDAPVRVSSPGPKGVGGSGLAGDAIGDLRHHGGDTQAVYAYAREDLDLWERELDRELPNGMFGENLTTEGLDINGALVGERWRIGEQLLLEVCSVRIPCRTFQGRLREPGWIKRFTHAARPGAYLRVVEPGDVRASDTVRVEHRPTHRVTVNLLFRALLTEQELLPEILEAGNALDPEARERALKHLG
ncbi:MOSC domain-containing protein [Streptomyces sp. P38-E01]|uniref:MOSC domain-containing protein n=1 Tax=Streptomyces tardus TaxID=2780544 RepID=A0A949JKI6_9ACTN|nr:MOSC domain-containing protein [Streptomyces tardus]MBU7596851.1 MOSC domain-containing protein [Streptomyces tardus]